MPEPQEFPADLCAERLRALGEPLRLRVVELLRNGELSVGDIAEKLNVELVTVSHHLQILKNSGFVTRRRAGRFIYYRLHESVRVTGEQTAHRINLGCCMLDLKPME